MDVKGRLKKYLDYRDIKHKDFTTSIGTSGGYINAIRKSISPDKIAIIKIKYPDLNIDWLLYEEGEMLNNSYSNAIKGEGSNAKILKEDEDFVWLETIKIPEKAALGAASNFFAESYMSELEKGRVRVKKDHKGDYYEVEATGDSMNDSTTKALLDKDWYLARDIPRDFWKSKLHLNHWNIFYFLHNEKGNLIKEVKNHNPETGEVLLHSWNPDKNLYPDFTINLKDCYIVGNVVKLISRDFNIFY